MIFSIYFVIQLLFLYVFYESISFLNVFMSLLCLPLYRKVTLSPSYITSLLAALNHRFFILFIFLISSVHFSFSQTQRIRWEENTSSFASTPIKFLTANSESDFWCYDLNGNLYHYFNGMWKKFSIPFSAHYGLNYFHPVSYNSFIIASGDKNYKTFFHLFENGKFSLLNFQIDLPLEGFITDKNGIIYGYGDWGTLIKYSNGKWEKINTPIKNHILRAILFNDLIYFGTRGEGVYSFDGSFFSKTILNNNEQTDIVGLLIKDNTLYAIDFSNQIYQLNDNTFNLNKNIRLDQIQKIHSYDFSFNKLSNDILNDNKDYLISVELNVVDFILTNKGNVLVSLSDGRTLVSMTQSLNFFTSMEYIYHIEGVKQAHSVGASFLHLNEDLLPDLFVLNYGWVKQNNLYLNRPATYFKELSSIINEKMHYPYSIYVFTDLNNNSLLDFCGIKISDNKGIIDFFEHTNNFNFKKLSQKIEINSSDIRGLNLSDIDNNGKIDFIVNNYLDKNRNKGESFFLLNKGMDINFQIDTTINGLSKGWNMHSISADFNNDNLTDHLIISRWGNNKLLINKENQFFDEFEKRFPNSNSKNSNFAISFDYDNDGDLDIFIASEDKILSFYENDGFGFFTDMSEQKFPFLNDFNPSDCNTYFLNSGDFNNDGYTDLILLATINKEEKLFLLINDSSNSFIDFSNQMNLYANNFIGMIVGDIDNDGDLDIYGYRNGENILWINNLNDSSYLKLFLKGVKSNSQAIGAKIWIYQSGFLDIKEKLVAYKQIGSDYLPKNNSNDPIIHFGLNPSIKYDIKILFPSGDEKYLYNISTGTVNTIQEIEGLKAFFYLLPKNIYSVIINESFQLYFLFTMFAFVILYVGINFGRNNFYWDFKLSSTFIVINISIYWIIVALNTSESLFIKHILPVIILGAGVIVPNFVFYLIKRNPIFSKRKQEATERLFELILNFSHGNWALSNINSLILLFSNFNKNNSNKEFYKLLEERINSFLSSNIPQLDEIFELLTMVDIPSELILDFKESIVETKKTATEILQNPFNENLSLKAEEFGKLKKIISSLKKKVFENFSCSPEQVINSIIQNHKETFSKENIVVITEKYYDANEKVIIKEHELSGIIDNLFTNALKAMNEKRNKKIEITLESKNSRIVIEVKDSGIGVENNIRDKIFEEGFSTFNSTGIGLPAAKEVLKKYSGRIYLKENSPGAVFVLELNKVSVL